MSSVYPGGFDNFPTNRADGTPMLTTHPADHNNFADAINQIEDTLGLDPQGDYDTVVERLDSGILISSTSISSAELLALHTTPVELLPAPGGRLYYAVHNVLLHFRVVTTPYAESMRDGLNIGYGSTNAEINVFSGAGALVAPLNSGTAAGDIFKSTVDTYVLPPSAADGSNLFMYVWAFDAIEDQALSIGINSGSLTGGDGTLTVRTFYSLIDGAP